MGKPLHDRIEAFRKHLADVERSCVANFSNEQITRGRVEALEQMFAAIIASNGGKIEVTDEQLLKADLKVEAMRDSLRGVTRYETVDVLAGNAEPKEEEKANG